MSLGSPYSFRLLNSIILCVSDNRKTFVVMYSRDSNEPDYLSLYVNEVIYSLDEEKDGWMKGEKKESGEIGWFPRNHVREGVSPSERQHHHLVVIRPFYYRFNNIIYSRLPFIMN